MNTQSTHTPDPTASMPPANTPASSHDHGSLSRRDVLGSLAAAAPGLAALTAVGYAGSASAQHGPTAATGAMAAAVGANAAHHASGHGLYDGAFDADAGEFTLPDLPYAYNALEPYIDEQTMRIHHDRHHAGYVRKLNNALQTAAEARKAGDYDAVRAVTENIAFNGGGHHLHTMFWSNMAPAGNGGGGTPPAPLMRYLDRDFGGLDNFKAMFAAAAKSVQGSGWGLLGVEAASRTLIVIQAENQHKLTPWGFTPVLGIDVWEHAYYLKYQNNRGQYVDNFWNIVNWSDVQRRVEAAMRPA